ncbi:COBRA-like protein, partial [Tanacetum coccineum]
AYDALDPNETSQSSEVVVTTYNFQQYRHVSPPGWTLGCSWAKKEVIWGMMGAQTTEQGDCSRYKGSSPHSYKKI